MTKLTLQSKLLLCQLATLGNPRSVHACKHLFEIIFLLLKKWHRCLCCMISFGFIQLLKHFILCFFPGKPASSSDSSPSMSTLLRQGRALDREKEIIDLEETVCVPRYDCSKKAAARQLDGGSLISLCEDQSYTDCQNQEVRTQSHSYVSTVNIITCFPLPVCSHCPGCWVHRVADGRGVPRPTSWWICCRGRSGWGWQPIDQEHEGGVWSWSIWVLRRSLTQVRRSHHVQKLRKYSSYLAT